MGTSEGLLDRAGQALRRLAAASALHLFVACTPCPPDRRVGRGGNIYWGPTYAALAGLLQREFALALPSVDPHKRGVVVGLESIFPKPKKTVLLRPKGDVDNLAKSPLDAITKTARLWEDDDQVERLFTAKRWADPDEIEGVHLIINTIED